MSASRVRTVRMRNVLLATASVAMVAAGCSSSGSSGGGSSSGSSGGKIDRDFILGSIEPMTGSNVLTQYIHGVEMAVKDINDKGGVSGRKIVLKEYDDGLDAQKTVTATRLAIEDKVDAVIGLPASIESSAAVPLLQRAGIIVLSAGVSTPIAKDETNAGDMTFRILTPMPELIYSSSQYVINTLKPKSIGMMGLNIDYGQNALPQFKKAFDDANIKVTASNLYPFTTTDVTTEVLAMKGSDAVLDWSYPNQMTLGLKSVGQNGLGNVPYIGGPSSSIVNSRSAVPVELQKNLYGVQSCNPLSDDRSYVQDWAKRYQSTFNEPPDYSSPSVYDAVFFLKKAIEEAGSLDHDAIAKKMKTVSLTDKTMCATEYKSDDRNQLSHQAIVMNFAGGTPKVVKTYTAKDLTGKGAVQK